MLLCHCFFLPLWHWLLYPSSDKNPPIRDVPERCALTNLRGFKPGRFFFSFVFFFFFLNPSFVPFNKSKLGIYWSTIILLYVQFEDAAAVVALKGKNKTHKRNNMFIFLGEDANQIRMEDFMVHTKHCHSGTSLGFDLKEKHFSVSSQVLLWQTASWRHFFSEQYYFSWF